MLLLAVSQPPHIGFPTPHPCDKEFNCRPVLSACFSKQPFDEGDEKTPLGLDEICDSSIEFKDARAML
jgi:hypothetical protein